MAKATKHFFSLSLVIVTALTANQLQAMTDMAFCGFIAHREAWRNNLTIQTTIQNHQANSKKDAAIHGSKVTEDCYSETGFCTDRLNAGLPVRRP
ncbi:MAG TPA: hypothetical protein VFV64_00220 [Permianibacter sp.]|nr:hypothetical protein [Permianibacter sp.]